VIVPSRLRAGDTIGIVSPASPVATFCPKRLAHGVENLEKMGFSVHVAEHATARHGHTAGTIEDRVSDIHAMFSDADVRAIITTIGGFNSNQLLEYLDYDLIACHPKVLMGYSDITAMLLAIHKMTGLVTFLGPAIMPQFGEVDGLHRYTTEWFRTILMEPNLPIELTPSNLSIHEELRWDTEDTRPRIEEPHFGPRVLRKGLATGPIIAGNLGTMLALVGTRYFPDLDGVILCIEDDEEESPATIDRFLTQLRHMGVFERIAALVAGRFHPSVGFSDRDSLKDIILTATEGCDIPIAVDFDFGHTDPMFILPNGVRAHVDFRERAHLQLLEEPVDKTG